MHVIDSEKPRSGRTVKTNLFSYRVQWPDLSRSTIYKINCTEAKKRSAVGRWLSKYKRYTLIKK